MDFDGWVNLILEELGEYVKFQQLPDKRPYGFVVYADGSVDDVHGMGGHEDMVVSKNFKNLDHFFNKGGVHLAYNPEDGVMHLLVDLRNTRSRKALRIAKDVCKWYNVKYKVESVHE
jgi:hypothetical protein